MKVNIYRSEADPLKFVIVPSLNEIRKTGRLPGGDADLSALKLYRSDVHLGPDHSAAGQIRRKGYAVLDTRRTGQFFAPPPR